MTSLLIEMVIGSNHLQPNQMSCKCVIRHMIMRLGGLALIKANSSKLMIIRELIGAVGSSVR